MWAYAILQALAILGAAAATVLAVAPWATEWIAAIPAAVATLAATALATFRIEEHWLRCRRAASEIEAQLDLFTARAGRYKRMTPVDARSSFVERVVAISMAGDQITAAPTEVPDAPRGENPQAKVD